MDTVTNDDYDPLAPMHVVGNDDAEPAASGGFADPDQIVRLWVEDDDIIRVRVSLAWRERLGERDLGRCFDAALALSRLMVPEPDTETPDRDLPDVDFSGLPKFTGDLLTTFQLAFDNFNRRWHDAAQRLKETPLPAAAPRPIVTDGVTVHLNPQGQVERVEFDEEWLEDVDSREIADAVMEASRRARASYERPQDPTTELQDLAREHQILITGLMRSLTGKEQR